MTIYYNVILFSLLYAIFNVTGAAIIKDKLITVKISGFQDFVLFLIDPRIMLALIFIFFSMFFSIKALSMASFSSVIPLMTAINFLITVAVGALLFKDQLTVPGYLGLVLILSGVFLLGKGYSGN